MSMAGLARSCRTVASTRAVRGKRGWAPPWQATAEADPGRSDKSAEHPAAEELADAGRRLGMSSAVDAFLSKPELVGLPAEDVMRRAKTVSGAGAAVGERAGLQAALSVSFASRLELPETYRAALAALADYGVNCGSVMELAPATLALGASTISDRLAQLEQAGFAPCDVAKIVSANPAVVAFPVDTNLFSDAEKASAACIDKTSTCYQGCVVSLTKRIQQRRVDLGDINRLNHVQTTLSELGVDLTTAIMSRSGGKGRPKLAGTITEQLLRLTPTELELCLGILTERPLCLSNAELAKFIRRGPAQFVALDRAVAQRQVAILQSVFHDSAQLRYCVLGCPAILLESAMQASIERLLALRMPKAGIAQMLRSPKSARRMLRKSFAQGATKRAALLASVVCRQRLVTELAAENGLLTFCPLSKLHLRLKLLEFLGKLNVPLAATMRMSTTNFANALQITPGYVEGFIKQYRALQASSVGPPGTPVPAEVCAAQIEMPPNYNLRQP